MILIHSNSAKKVYSYFWDSIAQAPFLYNSTLKEFMTFVDKRSVAAKTKFALDKQLGGIMFWRLNGDTYNNVLLDAIYQQINSTSKKK